MCTRYLDRAGNTLFEKWWRSCHHGKQCRIAKLYGRGSLMDTHYTENLDLPSGNIATVNHTFLIGDCKSSLIPKALRLLCLKNESRGSVKKVAF